MSNDVEIDFESQNDAPLKHSLNLIAVEDSTIPVLLKQTLAGQAFIVKYACWNPANPPPIPPGSSIIWLECENLSSTSYNSLVPGGFRSPIIASWPLTGTQFDGDQPIFVLPDNTSKLQFKLFSNLGEVRIVSANGFIVALDILECD